jgi:hypothetical protein
VARLREIARARKVVVEAIRRALEERSFIAHLNITSCLTAAEKAMWKLFAGDLAARTRGLAPYRSSS